MKVPLLCRAKSLPTACWTGRAQGFSVRPGKCTPCFSHSTTRDPTLGSWAPLPQTGPSFSAHGLPNTAWFNSAVPWFEADMQRNERAWSGHFAAVLAEAGHGSTAQPWHSCPGESRVTEWAPGTLTPRGSPCSTALASSEPAELNPPVTRRRGEGLKSKDN